MPLPHALTSPLRRYTHWLHGQWPAGRVEKLPLAAEDGATNLPGVYIVGDLTGIPLLKFSADSGTKAVRAISHDAGFDKREQSETVHDLIIIGGGCAGMAAALEARKQGLNFLLLEASEPFSTIANFPKGKPIYAYPSEMTPEGQLQFSATVKEPLLEELLAQTIEQGITPHIARAERIARHGRQLEVVMGDGADSLHAHRVIIAIGRSGNYRKLGVPGEELDKVSNRLHDPKDFEGKRVLVVGGGDSALETAIALTQAGAQVTLSYRQPEFSRAKPENVEQLERLAADDASANPHSEGSISLMLPSKVIAIDPETVTLEHEGKTQTLKNENVFTMIGREAPLDFFRRSGIHIAGETKPLGWAALALFVVFIIALYDWKNYGFIEALWQKTSFPASMPAWLASLGEWWSAQVEDRSSWIGTIAVSMKSRSFYYTLLYTACIGVFGIARIRRRRTPYVTVQTITLFLIQLFPLFLLPEVILPYLGYHGFFDAGLGAKLADELFPLYISKSAYLAQQWPEWGHPRAYWHAYGLILAWPLNVYNVFLDKPNTWWLVISFVQTFVILPAIIWRWGKGVYCGWICSCGALAETMGDTQRHKMPHGPFWNRLNMLGQFFLLCAFAMLFVRIAGWVWPESWAGKSFKFLLEGKNAEGQLVNPVSYKWFIDVLFGGILGVGFYFKYSGRVWCRFACPLAALMHIYARFSRFRIIPEKKKCISCNVCTSVCHQGIDVMSFANKGLGMKDPECVRCSACVQSCPTGVLQFGRVDAHDNVAALDRLPASRVLMQETSSSTRK